MARRSTGDAAAASANAPSTAARKSLRTAPATAAADAVAAEGWASRWLDAVAAGTSTMSQRSLASIDQRGGGLAAVRKLAKQRGVHLLLVKIDDSGADVVAASRSPFKVVC